MQITPNSELWTHHRMRNVFLFFAGLFVASCVRPPEYSDVPTLEFRSFSKDTMRQGVFSEDSVFLVLYFTDGDGDFGTPGQGTQKNIFIKDKRTNRTFREFKAPFVPVEGTGNGISGTITIKLFSTCCIYPEPSGIFPCEVSDEFPYNDIALEVFITDRAENKSNTITTPALRLQCN